MGGAASKGREGPSSIAAETKSLESRLAGLGELPRLQTVFAHLAGPHNGLIAPQALQACFELGTDCVVSSECRMLVEQVASTLIDMVFARDNDGISWTLFLKGFEKCHQPAGVIRLNFLLYYFFHLRKRAELPLGFSLANEDGHFGRLEMEGFMTCEQLQDFLWLCWLIGYDASMGTQKDTHIALPNVKPLLQAAVMSSSNSDESEMEHKKLPLDKLFTWMLLSIPGLGNCLSDYFQARIRRVASDLQSQSMDQKSGKQHDDLNLGSEQHTENISGRGLLSSDVSWAVGLSQLDTIGCRLMNHAYGFQKDTAFPLYRSSLHGKGMNRFWAHVEGYNGTMLVLILGAAPQREEGHTAESVDKEWLIGSLVREGFENKNCYYGSTGCCLFALKPLMQVLRSTGKGSNYVYTHSHVATSAYHKKMPEGIAFGGDYGNERMWLDEDFSHLTLRHHVVDKTYQMGHLLPSQDYMPLKRKILQIEVWGLGGAATKEEQAKYHQRESLFSEQKRKVNLQSFGNWVDSPEKVMLNLVADPNKVQREER